MMRSFPRCQRAFSFLSDREAVSASAESLRQQFEG